MVCVVTLGTGVVAFAVQEQILRSEAQQQMEGVAQSVAHLPSVIDAISTAHPSDIIQPIAEVIRRSSGMTYVVVTDEEGVRFSHPNTSRIGEKVSTDPSAPLSGQIWRGTEQGTLGLSYRVKVPIFDVTDAPNPDVIGSVSVGMLESELEASAAQWQWPMLAAITASALVGVFGAAWVTAIVRRRIFRLEPEEIATLVTDRETLLHRLSEGVVTVDANGIVTSANDAAVRLLGQGDLVGIPAADALESELLAALDDGEPDGRLVLVDETPLIVRSTGSHDDSGRHVGGTLLLRDNTELHAAVREMDGAQSLTDGLRAQAHEFANTLHVLSGLLELGHTDEARDYIARIQPGGSLSLDADTAGFGAEITALVGVKNAQAKEQGIRLSFTGTGHFPSSMTADVVTVLGNLIDNALDAVGHGDRVAVRIDTDRTVVTVVVEDSGAGVSPDVAGDVFAPGVSTKRSGTRGRGIGLALVRRIARRRGGDATWGSSALGGARFEAVLPRRQDVSP